MFVGRTLSISIFLCVRELQNPYNVPLQNPKTLLPPNILSSSMTPRREITTSTTNSSYPLKRRFALKFLKSLMRIKKSKPSSSLEICRRAHRIRLAAYSSMARVVGSRRAWSRALILRLRARKKPLGSIPCGGSRRCLGMRKRRSKKSAKRINNIAKKRLEKKGSVSRVSELRMLVPGGESMDLCSLLEETADFVRCLDTQVRVMRSIVDRFPC